MKLNFTRLVSIVALLIPFSINAQSNAIDFDGANDVVKVPNASGEITGTGGITLTMWVRPTNSSAGWPNFDGFGGIRNNSNADFYLLQLSSSNVEARFRNSSGTNYDIVGTGMQLNTWQHYAMTYNGTTLTLYRNGASIGSISASGSISSTTVEMTIGSVNFTGNNFFTDGRIDEVSLWNKGLTAAEVSCIYNYGINPNSTGLKMYYTMDQGTASANNSGVTSVIDLTGNINGTLQNSSLNGSTSNWVTGISAHTLLDTSICEGEQFNFSGQIIDTAGTHLKTFQTPGGCDSIVSLDLVVHGVDTTSPGVTICEGETYQFGTQLLAAEGTFTEVFTSGITGCDSVSVLTLDIDTLDTEVLHTGGLLRAKTVGVNYQWYDCTGDSLMPGDTSRDFSYTFHSEFAVIVSNANCVDTSACTYTALGVEGHGAYIPIKSYPNPVNDLLTLEFERPYQHIEVTVQDLTGKVVKSYVDAETSLLEINMHDVITGMYLIQVQTEAGNHTLKILVE